MKIDYSKIEARAIAAFFDQMIRFLYNSDKKRFVETFGELDGPYLWDQFTGRFEGNQESAFFCYLDFKNQEKLAQAVQIYAIKEDPRLK